tara:strand:- start:102 stop:371 length:270 start_codon:yes stop_codon:yes gene_type:complete
MSNTRKYLEDHHFASEDPRHPEYNGLEGVHFDTGEEPVDKILFEELGIPMSKRNIVLKRKPDSTPPPWKSQLSQANRRNIKISLKDEDE